MSRSSITVLLLIISNLLHADYKDDIGYSRLATELGASLPDGSDVGVTQSEADTDGVSGTPYACFPNTSDSRFSGKTITNAANLNLTVSSHATSVGSYLYGNTGTASGITQIDVYEANSWILDYLNYSSSLQPVVAVNRVGNHSWKGNVSDPAIASNILKRLDWVIETDDFIQFVGVRNDYATNDNLLSAAYNAIAVGKSNGTHGVGSPSLDSTYVEGRTRTEIVAPTSTSSLATPMVASTAALLVETSQTGALNLSLEGDTSIRSGQMIYNADRSETIRAALLAGADRYTRNITFTSDITDYRSPGNQSVNGLDSRFGAGQVNTYHSYHIIAAGEQNSLESGGDNAGWIDQYGFDYDSSFGGNNDGVATYYFSTTTPVMFHASLVWNLDVDGGRLRSFNETAILHDLDLYLYDITDLQTELIRSESTIDNSENLWLPLSANRTYQLQVTRKGNFDWDYALAWKIATDTDGDTFVDEQDNCLSDYNTSQADMDNDSIGDACDSDIDGDGTANTEDAFPYDPLETTDTDSDGIGNNADTDDDNDGLLDADEISTYGTDPLLVDSDGDNYSDFDEVNAGTDPLDNTSYPVTADGDLNNDGIVNILDILLGQQILAGIVPLTQEHLDHGDVAPLIAGTPSPDGNFNLGDLVVIQRKALDLVAF